MPETLRLYPSALARDAALESLPAAAWTSGFMTFAEFTGELGRLLPGRTAVKAVEGASRHGFLLRALERACVPAERSRYASDAALQSAGKLIAGWKSSGLTPDQVLSAGRALPNPCAAKETFFFLARLFHEYESVLTASRWTDREGAEHQLLSRLRKCAHLPARLLPASATLSLHGFHRLIPFQRAILERIAALGHPIEICALNIPHQDGEPKTDNLRATFGRLGSGSVSTPSLPPARHGRLVAPSPYAEAYEIGRRVRRWICDDGIAPASICVAVRDLGAYSQSLNDVFRRFAIPFYQRRGEPVAFQPIVRVALSALNACVNGLPRADVFRFLCAGPIDLGRLTGQRGVDGAALHALALAARIDRFFGSETNAPAAEWQSRLQNYEDSAEKPAPTLRKALVSVIEKMERLRAPKTMSQHAMAWMAFFDAAGLSSATLLNSAAAHNIDKERLSILELESALQSLQQGPLNDGAQIPLDTFASLLNLQLQEHSVRAEGAERGGVRMLNLYDLRGLSFEKLVLAGMSEGIFPAIKTIDPLLGRGSEHDIRSALAGVLKNRLDVLHLEPRTSDECEAEEEALFQIGCNAAGGGEILFSRPQTHFDGRSIGASTFWSHAFASAESSVEESAQPIHPAPSLAQCITREEAELRGAWILGNGSKDLAESGLALQTWARSERLGRFAELAAIERRRQLFFARQGIDPNSEATSQSARCEQIAPGAYDGVLSLTAPEVRERMAELLVRGADAKKASLSPSALETLAQCNFRYMVDRVLHVNDVEEPDGELSALDRGKLWHGVLAEFYGDELKAVVDAGGLVFRLDAKRRTAYLSRLRAIAARILDQAPRTMFVGHPGFWGMQKSQIDRLLEKWLDHELWSNQQTQFHVAAAEFDFGPKVGRPVKISLDAARFGAEKFLLLEGRMDRLDFLIEAPDATPLCVKGLRVIDYKIGRGDSYKKNIGEENLSGLLLAQLPIYLKAAIDYVDELEKAGKISVDWESIYANSRAGYYCLKDLPGKVKEQKESVVEITDWPLQDLRKFLTSNEEKSLFNVIRNKVGTALSGNFSVTPVECNGPHCSARFICRYQAVPADGASGEKAD